MPYWRNYYHLVWPTKHRAPLIQPEIENWLYRYLISKGAELGCYTYAVGGIEDHVHVVSAIPPKHSVAYIVKTLKGSSSHYINHVICPENTFAWQRGYGCQTMGESYRLNAIRYVQQQKRLHAQQGIKPWLERMEEQDEGPLDVGMIHW